MWQCLTLNPVLFDTRVHTSADVSIQARYIYLPTKITGGPQFINKYIFQKLPFVYWWDLRLLEKWGMKAIIPILWSNYCIDQINYSSQTSFQYHVPDRIWHVTGLLFPHQTLPFTPQWLNPGSGATYSKQKPKPSQATIWIPLEETILFFGEINPWYERNNKR